MSDGVACLASGDPTNTQAIRKRFISDVSGRFRDLRGLLRKWVGYEEDVFGLAGAGLAEGPDDVFRFDTTEGKVGAFMQWLKDRIQAGVLEPASDEAVRDGGHWTAKYVRSAYGRGWETATSHLRDAGLEVDDAAVGAVFDKPVARRKLRKLYVRTFENLRDITRDLADDLREVLTQGLADGVHPRRLADRLTDEVDSVEASRARTLARTEVINSHSTATLDRYEEEGVGSVQHGEWETADDDRVCPVCASLDGREFPLDEFRDGTFRFDPPDDVPDYYAGEYRLRPPAHPDGRCAILPVIG